MIASARVLTSYGGYSGGTAFAISRELALTAFHVIGDRENGMLYGDHVDLLFDGFAVRANICGQDKDADVAVLRLQESLPAELKPASPVTNVAPDETWFSPTFPAALSGQITLRGIVVAPEGYLPGTAIPAIQLQCDQSSAGNPLPLVGASGGPVLVDGSYAAGIIRWNPTHPDRPDDAIGGIVYACPIEAAVRCCPDLIRPLLVPRVKRIDRISELLFQLADDDGLPLVRDMEPHGVGATPTRYSERELAPYIPRKVDAKIRALIRQKRFVLLLGPSKSGKSRTAFEALRDERSGLHDASFMQPRVLPGTLNELIGMDTRERLCTGELVIWLDDLDEYIRAGGNFDPALWNRISHRSPRAIIVATMTQQRFDALLAEGGDTARFLRQVMQGARVDLRPELDSEYVAYARSSYPYEDFREGMIRIAERLTRGDELVRRLRSAEDEEPNGFAVTMAAIDWERIGLTRVLPRRLLQRLYVIELSERFPHLNPSSEGFADGLAWALTMAVSRVSLISRQPAHEESYKVFDYAEQIVSDESWYLPEAIWDFAIDTEGMDEVWQVAVTADTVHKRPDIAQHAYQELLQRGDPSGALGIGRQLALEGRIDDARDWFEQAIEDGLSWVMLELGVLLAPHDRDESVIWLRRALDAGYPEAALNLGTLADHIDHSADDALYWYRTATTAGVRVSRIALAALLIENNQLDEAEHILDQLRGEPAQDETRAIAAAFADRGDVEEAEWWWRWCAQTGEASSVSGLAKFLSDNDRSDEAVKLLAPIATTDDSELVNDYAVSLWRAGRLADAEHQFRRIAGLGDPAVLQNIADLCMDQGRVREAEEWYQQAAHEGNDYAIACLAELAGQRGDADEQLRLYREAAIGGVPIAQACLGRILVRRGELGEAKELLEAAAEAGEVSAANELGMLCADTGAFAEAHYWYILASAESSSEVPLWNLGKLLWSERRLALAAWAFQEAADRGATGVEPILASLYQDDQDRLHYEDGLRTRAEAEAEAAYELGAALAFSGELPEARRWLQRAVDAGVASASLQLGELETELGNNTPAMRHFKAAAQADDSVGMVRLARLLLKQEDTDTAEKWLKLAYSQGSNAAAAYLAVLHDKAGNRQAADEWLERAGDGEDVDCLLGRAELAARRGADADASQLFIRAANGGSTRALLEVITPFSRPEPDRAAFWLEVAATWSPLVAAVYAALMARMNHFDEAKDAADSAAEAGMIMAKRHLVDVLMSKGDTEQAEAICREVLTDTRDPIDAFNLAVVCSERGDAEEALHYYRTAADGGMVMAKVNLAGMLVKSGNVDEAMSLLDAAINRGNTDAFAMRGLIAETGGDLAGAEQWYRRAQSASSSAAQRLAKISLDRDDTEAAITALLPSATDGNPQSATRLALIYDEKIGDAESAEHWYRSAATRGNDIAAYKLAKIHANRGEDELAERWLRRAVEDGSGIAAHDIGELMLGRGLLAAAEEWYRKSFELGHIDAAFDVGTMMAALNRNEDAQYWWATGIARRDLGVSVDELIANHKISVLVTRDPNDTGKKVYVISI